MDKIILAVLAAWFLGGAGVGPALAADDDEAKTETEKAAPPAYVEREVKVINYVSGKVETERVIEFPEVEILSDISKPVTIVVPRQKPDFDKISQTIYNNEPPLYVPEDFRLEYYRRIPVRDIPADDPGQKDIEGTEDTAGGETAADKK